MLEITTITRKGQITIPIRFRRSFNLNRGQKIKFIVRPSYPQELILKPIPTLTSLKGTFKTDKKYNKKTAREVFIKDIVTGKS